MWLQPLKALNPHVALKTYPRIYGKTFGEETVINTSKPPSLHFGQANCSLKRESVSSFLDN